MQNLLWGTRDVFADPLLSYYVVKPLILRTFDNG